MTRYPFSARAKDPRHLRMVAELPCVACGKPGPSVAHHCICGRGSQRKASDAEAIPLCAACHDWVHHRRTDWLAAHGPDFDLLPRVAEMLRRERERTI